MNWNAIVAISQLIAAVGVILSLVFVGLQIKQNTRALQRTEHNSTMEQWTVIRQAIAQNRDIAELMTTGLRGESDLDAADHLRLDQMLQENGWAAFHIWTEPNAASFRKGLSKRRRGRFWANYSERRVARLGGAPPNISASILDLSRTSMPFSPRPNESDEPTACDFL